MRINFLGGSGIGKSTVAARLFAGLKPLDYSVELVPEYVKTWAYQKRKINLFDQNYIFAKQQQYEYRYISNGVGHVVTDSPTMLPTLYTKLYYGEQYSKALELMDDQYEAVHPSFNILLIREGEFNPEGRYQVSEEDASQVDRLVLEHLETKGREFITALRS